VPAQFRVIATIRPRYACPKSRAGVVQAPAPAHLIEGGLPTEALIAHVLVGKFADYLPLYRHVWMAPASQGKHSWMDVDRLRSCVRPR
jgi:transposase